MQGMWTEGSYLTARNTRTRNDPSFMRGNPAQVQRDEDAFRKSYDLNWQYQGLDMEDPSVQDRYLKDAYKVRQSIADSGGGMGIAPGANFAGEYAQAKGLLAVRRDAMAELREKAALRQEADAQRQEAEEQRKFNRESRARSRSMLADARKGMGLSSKGGSYRISGV